MTNRPRLRSRRTLVVALAAALIVVVGGVAAGVFWLSMRRSDTPVPGSASPASCAPKTAMPKFQPASFKGIDYEFPTTVQGRYVGTEWLRAENWAQTSQRLDADLTFLQQNHMGNVLRVFVGLDQLMVWDKNRGFVRFDPNALKRFDEALSIFHRHGFQLVLVLYDQEDRSSAGNFHIAALDGNHDQMRANYLKATQLFMRQYGSTPGVLGWDLFNEAYNSLTADGGLPSASSTSSDPVSPQYSTAVVHAWLRDLYAAAKCGAPQAWLTVSDATVIYGHDKPDLSKYADSVDFYDVHVYEDQPQLQDWTATLGKPVIIGEAGADEGSNHFDDQAYNAVAVHSVLVQGQQNQVSAVLAHSDGSNVFTIDGHLTATGRVISSYGD
ncbi:MAG: cellulase family glycosylhydrolase [Candidatus Dormibacteraeota bacterium]|nr:cellulase family glycosylhydrolase [Candidatus Dormibacteraeota bacterium]MBO0759653.1 cellulase family glycosylhydrolase [Candidatus Dormibacteraeota bacterium]